jgi:TonB family protein
LRLPPACPNVFDLVRIAPNLVLLALALCGCRETAARASTRSASESRTEILETSPRFTNAAWRQPSAPREQVSPRRIDLPRFSRGDPPSYPEESVRLHEEGAVDLRFDLLENGAVRDLEVERSSGHARLDTAALEAARTWRFNPTTGGAEVAVIRYRLEFRLVDE